MKKTFSLLFMFMLMISKSAYSQTQPFICVTQEQQDFADLWRMYIQDIHDINLVEAYQRTGGFINQPTEVIDKNINNLLNGRIVNNIPVDGLNPDAVGRANQIQQKILPNNTITIPTVPIPVGLAYFMALYVVAGDAYSTSTEATKAEAAEIWLFRGNEIANFMSFQIQNPLIAAEVEMQVQQSLTIITNALIRAFDSYVAGNTSNAQELTNEAIETAAELAVYLLSVNFA